MPERRKMKRVCACGEKMTIRQLRIHIAILTPHWPRVRCDEQHHDPMSNEDMQYLAQKGKLPLIPVGRGFACD